MNICHVSIELAELLVFFKVGLYCILKNNSIIKSLFTRQVFTRSLKYVCSQLIYDFKRVPCSYINPYTHSYKDLTIFHQTLAFRNEYKSEVEKCHKSTLISHK